MFWYEAALKSPMPFGNSPAAILGLVAFELFAMHYVEVRRAYDLKNPGSVDQDPIFKNYRWSSKPFVQRGVPCPQASLPAIALRGVGLIDVMIGDLAHYIASIYGRAEAALAVRGALTPDSLQCCAAFQSMSPDILVASSPPSFPVCNPFPDSPSSCKCSWKAVLLTLLLWGSISCLSEA